MKGDIIYEVDPDDSVTFDRDDFWDFLDDETGDDLEYVRFTDADGLDDWGELYSYDYDDDRTYFDESDLDDGYFYYDSKDLFYDETSPWMILEPLWRDGTPDGQGGGAGLHCLR